MSRELEASRFLKKLQKDLLQDRENEKCQADPIYYGILDVHEYVCPEGHADNVKLYDEDGCEEYTTDQYFASLSNEEKEYLCEDSGSGVIDWGEGEGPFLDDDYAFAECIEEANPSIHVFYTQDVNQIEQDLFFLTRKSAKEYLQKKNHHHTKYARSYAMTASYNPEYRELLEIIKSVDWDKSKLILKET